jgi:predicted PurR-regulated permease PerM
MKEPINNNEKLDIKNLNNAIRLGNNILKMLVVFLSIIGLYAITLIFKEWKIVSFFLTILTILAPFFIGLVIAWLLDPCVKFINKKGISRVLGTIFTYFIMIAILYLIITTVVPILLNQVNEFIATLPPIINNITDWANKSIDRFKDISFIDITSIKGDITKGAQDFITSLTKETPTMIFSFVKSFISGAGIFALGLMVGFYLLFDFDNIGKTLLSLLPKRARDDATSLFKEANSFLFSYVKGTLLVSLAIFVLSTIIFIIAGLKAPLLFGLICGITNVIPYIGPYLGGVPAVIVGFSQGLPTGIISLIGIFVIQFIEGNLIHPIVMSKTMRLHPVTIIIGLLIFGYFFGIVGMIIATPLVAMIKSIFVFLDKKYNFFRYNDKKSIK